MKDNYDISDLSRKPKRKNSRRKGNTFELQTANLFNETFNSKEFSRAPTSGAFASTHNLPEHLKFYGDLLTPKDFRFCIECKHGYPKVNLSSLYNNSSEFWSFLDQCEKDSRKASKTPMVIYKQDRQPVLAVVPQNIDFMVDNHVEVHLNHRSYKIYQLKDILNSPVSMWFA